MTSRCSNLSVAAAEQPAQVPPARRYTNPETVIMQLANSEMPHPLLCPQYMPCPTATQALSYSTHSVRWMEDPS